MPQSLLLLTGMNSKVHIISHPLIESFGTMRTGIFLPISMNLQMTAEVSPVVEDFATFGTLCSEFFRTLMDGSEKSESKSKKVKIKETVLIVTSLFTFGAYDTAMFAY